MRQKCEPPRIGTLFTQCLIIINKSHSGKLLILKCRQTLARVFLKHNTSLVLFQKILKYFLNFFYTETNQILEGNENFTKLNLFQGVFRTMPDIYDRAICENS